MSKSDDPERLLAEALRAQAVSAPVTMPPLPAVLTEAAGRPEAVESVAETPEPVASVREMPEPPLADEAVADKPPADEAVADEAVPVVEDVEVAAEKPVAVEEEPAPVAEPAPAPELDGNHPFTEEMVLRELSSGPMTGELATLRINNAQQQYDTERFSPLENLYGPVGGPGFGLISGSEVGSTVGPPVGEFDHLLPPPPSAAAATTPVATTRMRAERGQVPGWLILLFALVLGLAGGAVAGLLSML